MNKKLYKILESIADDTDNLSNTLGRLTSKLPDNIKDFIGMDIERCINALDSACVISSNILEEIDSIEE